MLGRALIAQKLVEIAAHRADARAVAHGAVRRSSDRPGARALSRQHDRAGAPVRRAGAQPPAGRRVRAPPPPRAIAWRECPDEPAFVEITFTRGAPAAINGIAMPLVDLIGSLDIIAGAHGVGRSEAPRVAGGHRPRRRAHGICRRDHHRRDASSSRSGQPAVRRI